MRKQSFDGVRKTVCILLAVLFLVSLTAASASAWYNKKGEIVSAPETTTTGNVTTPVTTTTGNVSTPVTTTTVSTSTPKIAAAAGALGTKCDSCNKCDDNKLKVTVITAVRAGFAEGDGCFDRPLW
ncbi:MAG: hypothetical protein EHM20_16105 [Alphaproteobacteria bacterium]|nr:MAG: hypothetical protein EHM20_16105 [Alphaproteobacteria bacterium]